MCVLDGMFMDVAGGWRDVWDELDDHAEFRARAEATERRQTVRVERLGRVWQTEILAETAAARGTPARCEAP
jgi:hypothetical protein